MFRFTIRDVLWLTVVVALGAAWGLDRQSIKGQAERLQNAVDDQLASFQAREAFRKFRRDLDPPMVRLVLAPDKPNSPAIEVGRSVSEMTAAIRAHKIEWRVEAFAEAIPAGSTVNPDIANGYFDLGEEMLARVYYSQSRKVITGIIICVRPKGEGRRTHRDFAVKRIQLEDDGSFSVQFLPLPKSKPDRSP